jgi:signal peptidase I
MKAIWEWVKEIIIAVIIASILLAFVKPIIIRQSSMEPTFYNGDYVFISKQAYNLFGDPQYGDVVVFHTGLQSDDGEDKNLIKRIIGLPGDTMEVIDGYVYRNGEKLDETYINEQGVSGNMEEITVPEGELFCMGDNRRVSLDSRDAAVGCVDQEEVLGKVFVRIYPFSAFETF